MKIFHQIFEAYGGLSGIFKVVSGPFTGEITETLEVGNPDQEFTESISEELTVTNTGP